MPPFQMRLGEPVKTRSAVVAALVALVLVGCAPTFAEDAVLSVAPSGSGALIGWPAATDGDAGQVIASYRIDVGGVEVGRVASSVRSCQLTGLPAGVSQVRVTAYDTAGEWSGEVAQGRLDGQVTPPAPVLGDASPRCVPPECPPRVGLDLWVWTGADSTDPLEWENPANWDGGTVGPGFGRWPGQRLDPLKVDDYVCIPIGGEVRLTGGGVSANILVLENRGDLTVGSGAKLELLGTLNALPYTSHSHRLALASESALFGSAELVVDPGGRLELVRDGNGGPRLSTRDDPAPSGPCQSATYDSPLGVGLVPLEITVASGADLTVAGGGVNYWDHTSVINLGTVSLLDASSYIAADYGTSFSNFGTFEFGDDGDYVQGCARAGQPLGTFTNAGLVSKTGGLDESVLDADYSVVGGGAVAVASGTIRIYEPSTAGDPPPVVATVAAGATIATGGCAVDVTECSGPETITPDPQVAALIRPAGAATVPVTINLDPPSMAESGTLGKTVVLTAASVVDPANPMVFSLTVDGALAAGKTTATVVVKHDGMTVPDCAPVPVPSPACVVRPAVASSVGQPVTLQIRTTQNGRWRFL